MKTSILILAVVIPVAVISSIAILFLLPLNSYDKSNIKNLQVLTLPIDCSKGTPVPFSDFNKGIDRVLFMQPNSTAVICVTFYFNFSWAQYPNKEVYPHGLFNVSDLNLPSKSFQVTANPSVIDLVNITSSSNITVMYKIHANPEAAGSYDQVVPFSTCFSYPLAVVYNASQIKLSDFPSFSPPIHSCFVTIDEYHYVKIISGMNYT